MLPVIPKLIETALKICPLLSHTNPGKNMRIFKYSNHIPKSSFPSFSFICQQTQFGETLTNFPGCWSSEREKASDCENSPRKVGRRLGCSWDNERFKIIVKTCSKFFTIFQQVVAGKVTFSLLHVAGTWSHKFVSKYWNTIRVTIP